MGSDDISEIWHIVIHHTEHYDRSAILKFVIDNEFQLTVQEDADDKVKRTHYHIAWRLELPKSRAQVKLIIKKALPLLTGKKDYTTHLPEEGQDWNGLLRYLSKGKGPDWETQGPDVIYNFSEYINVQQYHADYWQVQEDWKANKNKQTKEKSKKEGKTRDEIVKQIVAQFKDIEDSNLMAVIKATFKAYGGACDTRQLFIASQMVMFRLDANFTTDLIANKVHNMFF